MRLFSTTAPVDEDSVWTRGASDVTTTLSDTLPIDREKSTGWVWNFPSLFLTRLLFGAGESGCFPGLASVFRRWLPPAERNTAEGVKAASARWGAAIAPSLIAVMIGWIGWRQMFTVFGVIGVLTGVAFFRWYRDEPRDHPSVNEGELALIPAASPVSLHRTISWSKLLRSPSVWALGLQWFSHYYGFYFYVTWLPLYLSQARHMDLRHEALAAGLPLFAAGLGSLVAGWSLSALTRLMGDTTAARRMLCYISYGGAALLLLLFTLIGNSQLAVIILSVSSFMAELSGPPSWTTAMEIGGEHTGVVSGFMNTLGQLGGSVAPAVTGFLLVATGNGWNITFYISAAIYAAGGICWMLIDPAPLNLSPVRR
jgi:ACS family glucarate transporter-like MFS transporter